MPRPPKPLDPTRSAAHWLGAELRHWRELRKLSQDELGALVHLSGDLISKFERAERPCKLRHATALDAALDTGGVLSRSVALAEAEMDNRSREMDNSPSRTTIPPRRAGAGGTLEGPLSAPEWNESIPMERRNFLAATSTALAAGPLLQLMNAAPAAAAPSVVRPADVEQIRAAATTLRSWDNLYGGAGVVRDTALAQLRWAGGLLNSSCPAPLKADLFSAVSRLATVVGASAFDAFAHDDAHRLFAFATSCAEEVDNWPLRAISYNLRSRQATWRGDPDSGLTLAELGLARADRLSPAERSMLHNARARALAKMGRTQQTLTSIGLSDDSFASVVPTDEGSWMAYYDSAQHHGDTGHALFDLALAGHPPQGALRRLRTAVDSHGDGFARSRTFSRTKLATLRMAAGDPEQALADGRTALAEVSQLRSLRANHELGELGRVAHRHRTIPDIRDLREQITSTVAV
ncbi:helix-turn-helix transcriptional regulator [Kitasatospora sp. MAP5-34]|uniref:helix-turn-helix domain-containing protein n=1 Tax=Kitasatospora sp. MAP5-34 TaxID=3035102 RepID=UPI002474618B|nr:helix-turn-helix transcriptional regulator [Kitasatospora sp. MAP5-34]MDH6580320.1 transcriptional regulator with XRE-family HTH domain [Kitasatospora sp. MAP5-34]